jgi:Protein of unknown function (DUF1569)
MNAATIQPTPVNTSKVAGRRQLHFTSLDEIQADAERLASGPVRQLGNWSVGQATAHLARTTKMSLDGDPRRAPLPVRLLLRVLRNRILTKGMQPGFKLPKEAAKAYVADPEVSVQQGLSELRTSIARLKSEPQRHPHPAMGALSRDQWEQLHLRHAELHLSFFVPE